MLAAAQRLRRREDFAATIRNGRRAGRGALVVHFLQSTAEPAPADQASARAGFVVSAPAAAGHAAEPVGSGSGSASGPGSAAGLDPAGLSSAGLSSAGFGPAGFGPASDPGSGVGPAVDSSSGFESVSGSDSASGSDSVSGSGPAVGSVSEAGGVVPARAGFVVSKAVGNAVVRNLVKRRLRHLIRPHLADLPPASMIVVRALPASATARYEDLGRDLEAALTAARRPRSREGRR